VKSNPSIFEELKQSAGHFKAVAELSFLPVIDIPVQQLNALWNLEKPEICA
jgi:hypothetical protein